jgi:hypothetical protein
MSEMSLLIKLYERSKSVVLEGHPAIEFLLDSGEIASLAHMAEHTQVNDPHMGTSGFFVSGDPLDESERKWLEQSTAAMKQQERSGQ